MGKSKKLEREAARQADIDRIADRLRIGRKVLGLKSSELCELTGIARNTYSQWENGKGRPPLDMARVLRRQFGFTLDWLYEGDPSGLPMKLAQAIAECQNPDQKQPKTGNKAA